MRPLLLAFVLAACAQRGDLEHQIDPRIAHEALMRWEAAGHPSYDCEDGMDRITMEFIEDQKEVRTRCMADRPLCGCMYENSLVIALDESGCDLDTTIEHELRHWLAACVYRDADPDHGEDSVWFPMDGKPVR